MPACACAVLRCIGQSRLLGSLAIHMYLRQGSLEAQRGCIPTSPLWCRLTSGSCGVLARVAPMSWVGIGLGMLLNTTAHVRVAHLDFSCYLSTGCRCHADSCCIFMSSDDGIWMQRRGSGTSKWVGVIWLSAGGPSKGDSGRIMLPWLGLKGLLSACG